MANQEHLDILRQGVEAWNRWKEEHLEVKQTLRCPLLGPALSGADLRDADLSNVDLRDVDLRNATLTLADISGANLKGADLRDVDLRNATLTLANLSNVDLKGADLRGAVLKVTNFSHADLKAANFSDANLSRADLSDANLTVATFNGANLQDANLANAEIGYTVFANNDLSSVNGLETVKHIGPSTIGIDTLFKSSNNLPEIFLRGCGVPDTFITYARSLVGKAIDFYKCFISFTEADDAISERLYNDLQAAGVRCWRWKEDAKWGKPLMRSIDEAVRVYDKLVVICSEQSLNSPAVIREIERALQKEDNLARQGKEPEVLFPIRLDDYIFTGWQHYRKADVLAKNVGDFRNWTEPMNYRSKFERLLRDLKAEGKA